MMNVRIQAGALCYSLLLAGAIMHAGKNKCLAQITATGDNITIRCTDAIGTIATNAPAMVDEDGEVGVPIDRLIAIASTFAEDAIIDIKTTSKTVNIACGSSITRLPALPVTDLPEPVVAHNVDGTVEINSADCLWLLETLAAAEKGRARLYLTGVFLHNVDDRLVAVSTDGTRLIRSGVPASWFSGARHLIVPKDAALVVRKLLQKIGPSRITLHCSRSLIEFMTPAFTFTARLIDGIFPAYEAVIPAPAANIVICDRKHLLSALSRLSAAAADLDIGLVAMRWGDGKRLDIFLARQPLDGADNIDAEARGKAEVALPLSQLTAMLNEFCCERIQIETANEQPVVIRGEHDKLALIVRSRWNFHDRPQETIEEH